MIAFVLEYQVDAAKNSGIAIGSGWKFPSVMSRRTTALVGRGNTAKEPTSAPGASVRRRVNKKPVLS
jgi:hypothetical protein